jgi:hypothetical protein
MIKKSLSVFFAFVFFAATAQVSSNDSLFKTILQKDSLLFDVGFNTCDVSQFENLLSEQFDFFHDKSGISNKAKFLTDFRNGLCKDPKNFQARRELIKNSTKIYALYNNGILYGAIQEGTHQFFETINGRPENFGSSAKFTHVWILENGVWKLSKSLSFEHVLQQIKQN